ncbi:helix-turn-helix domain-containing protein [Streptomyces pactum]|uniref:HTH araC/xylS-type domain-containing protein n=1 Tax=Streptomyces pactum TaxID=68249 RepID=A0A1S6J4M0_9ACTN|nr:helix-turn-helix domain-containing protein [Streptomyces pactum]AQS66717.1 hypothetical protein B1H29_07035 [Streptomyces pactum]
METLFDSDELMAAERADGWAETTSRSLVPTEFRFLDEGPLRARLRAVSLGDDVQLSALAYSSLSSRRTPALIRRSDPELYQLALVERGRQGLEQCGRSVSLESGDMVLYDSSHPFEATVATDTGLADSLVLQFPKRRLPFRDTHVSRLLAVPLSGRTGVGLLLARFLTGLSEEAARCTPQDATRLETTTLDLVSAVLAHHLDRERVLPRESQQHVLFLRIGSFIRSHLGTEDLTPAHVARAHQMSVRALHRLFAQHDTTVAGYIRQARLEHCRRDLAAPHLSHLPVHAIGARWGYLRPAAFNRVFRTAYGVPPGEYRDLALPSSGTHR